LKERAVKDQVKEADEASFFKNDRKIPNEPRNPFVTGEVTDQIFSRKARLRLFEAKLNGNYTKKILNPQFEMERIYQLNYEVADRFLKAGLLQDLIDIEKDELFGLMHNLKPIGANPKMKKLSQILHEREEKLLIT